LLTDYSGTEYIPSTSGDLRLRHAVEPAAIAKRKLPVWRGVRVYAKIQNKKRDKKGKRKYQMKMAAKEIPFLKVSGDKYRPQIEDLGVSSWIGVVNNPWFDWSPEKGFWGVDVKSCYEDNFPRRW
jgi:hypothetical protein